MFCAYVNRVMAWLLIKDVFLCLATQWMERVECKFQRIFIIATQGKSRYWCHWYYSNEIEYPWEAKSARASTQISRFFTRDGFSELRLKSSRPPVLLYCSQFNMALIEIQQQFSWEFFNAIKTHTKKQIPFGLRLRCEMTHKCCGIDVGKRM